MKLNECKKHPSHDTYICQKCGRILCSGCFESEWRTDITNNEHAGNVCPDCVKAYSVLNNIDIAVKKYGEATTENCGATKQDLIKIFS